MGDLNQSARQHCIFQAVWGVFCEFCSNSTIHGVRYFTEKKQHWTERVWWIVAFSISFSLCWLSIHTIWMRWIDDPVTMSLTEKEVPISAIPFPTVTICPETKVRKHKLDLINAYHALSELKGNLSEIELARMEALSHICAFYNSTFAESFGKFTNESVYDIIQDIAPNIIFDTDSCLWKYKQCSFSEIFKPILTGEGLCYTFNALNSHDIYSEEMAPAMMIVKDNPNVTDWSVETGYKDVYSLNEYPNRVFNSKRTHGLLIYPIIWEDDVEYLCRGDVKGYKVILSMPGEALKMSHQTFRLPILEQLEIAVKPTLVVSSEKLLRYKPDQRECYFSAERKLRFFKQYTQHNCVEECLANYTKQECGCVKFSMPRLTDTLICGAGNLDCYQEAETKLFGEDIIEGLLDEKAKEFRKQCNCLSSCTTIKYDADVNKARLDWPAVLKSYNIPLDKFKGIQPSKLTVYFKEHEVLTLKRSELYTYTHFLSICGGLLGLFLGVSLLSIIEFSYYFTLRLFWALRLWKSEKVDIPYNGEIINNKSAN